MGMYPNMMQPIPFMKHKSKHPPGATQEKNTNPNEKNEETEQMMIKLAQFWLDCKEAGKG